MARSNSHGTHHTLQAAMYISGVQNSCYFQHVPVNHGHDKSARHPNVSCLGNYDYEW